VSLRRRCAAENFDARRCGFGLTDKAFGSIPLEFIAIGVDERCSYPISNPRLRSSVTLYCFF